MQVIVIARWKERDRLQHNERKHVQKVHSNQCVSTEFGGEWRAIGT